MKLIIITKHWFAIGLIVVGLASLGLRLYQLGSLPEAFAADEAALGYNGWSLLTTGRDEWGDFLPLTLRSFDDNKPAIYSYLTIPGIVLLGLNETTARLPAALFGAALPLFVAFLLQRLTKNRWLALLTAAVITFSPWHIEISRTAIEAGVALSMTILGIWLVTYRDRRWRILGVGIIVLSLFTYHTARIIAPMIVLAGLGFEVFGTKGRKLLLGIFGGLFLLGIFLSLTESSWRFEQISIFSDLGAELKREEAIREDGVWGSPVLLSRVMHNKPLSWVYSFSQSYVTNTSLSYLFLGGAQPPRVTIPEVGQFHLMFLPFFAIGIWQLIRRWDAFSRFVLLWMILAPIPASLTTAELPHTYRTLYLLPPVAIAIGMGLWWTIDWLRQQHRFILICGIAFLSMGFVFNSAKNWHQYVVHQQLHQPWYRQYGYENLITYLNSVDAEHITMTNREGEPYIFVLFYNQIEPKTFQDWPQKRLAHADIEAGVESFEMFEYTFHEAPCPHESEDTNPNNYYVVMPSCELPDGFERVKTIRFMDGAPEFYVDKPVSG